MKLAKLSLAAIVVAGLASSSFAADTLADAFAKGKITGELKAWYFDATTDPATGASTNANITNTAITLGYVTDAFNGFTFGATFQGSANPLSAESSAKTVFKDTQDASGATLSEAYIAYNMKNTTVKVGRQFIATPVVGGSGSRIFTEAFEGAVIINTDLPATTLIAGYVDKFQGRTSNVTTSTGATTTTGGTAGDAPTFSDRAVFTGGAAAGLTTYFEDAYTAAIINKSITNLTVTGQYALVNDVAHAADVDVYYVEGNYVLPMSSFKLGFDANYRASKAGSGLASFKFDGSYTAVRASIIELAGFGASFAYGTVSANDNVIMGMGNGPTSYTSTMIRGTSTRTLADTDSYLFAATYDFSKVGVAGLTALAQYGWTSNGKVPSTTSTVEYTNKAIGLTYVVPALKGLTTSLQYETQDADTTTIAGVKTTVGTDELWFKAGYKF